MVQGAVEPANTVPLKAMLEQLPKDLRRQVFTHSSWVEDRQVSYERLAFLGDSVLGLAISTALFPQFEDYSAGDLTKLRAQTVSGRSCARVAGSLDVPELLRAEAPRGIGQSVDALAETERVLASVVEAIIGACYLTFGFERVSNAVVGAFQSEIDYALDNVVDFKSSLQEYLARHSKVVVYKVVGESGPPHDRLFRSVAKVSGEVVGEGSGRSKKESEQEAAKQALKDLRSGDSPSI